MRPKFAAPLRVAAAALLLLAASAALPAPRTAFADAVDDAIEAMEDAAKDKDDGVAIAKMVELQDNLDERVTKALVKLTKARSDKVAAAAVRMVATRKDEKFGKSIKGKLDDKKLAKEHIDVYHAYLDAAAMYADPKLADPLADVVKKYLPTDHDISTRAIRAFGAVREKDTVDQLLEWLVQTENTSGGGSGKNLSDATREAYGKAKAQILETLEELTGQAIGDSTTWKEFWDDRRKTFEFPDPNAPKVDPATLDEWTDVAYGYTVKKPSGEGWKFADPGNEFERMWLANEDSDELVMARVSFQLHNLSTQNPKTLKELAAWYEKDFAENRLKDMREPPKVEERKIGGREFTVITGKGESGGNFAGWGAAEMRAYLTQVGHIVVRFEGTCRLGAEPEVKEALWSAIEKMEWKD